MEQYSVNRTDLTLSIVRGKYYNDILEKHKKNYGEKGANNIVRNVLSIYQKLMEQVKSGVSRNSLLVGKVQSGKTSNLELLSALAFDNGYNFLLIWGGYDKELLRQCTERFGKTFDTDVDVRCSDSPVLFTTNTLTDGAVSIHSLDAEFVKQLIEDKRPIIITCLKRPKAMQLVLKAIKNIQELNLDIKPFIIDDEGDQASLNTAKDKERNSTPTYKIIVSIKKVLRNPLYLSVTATPQANIFQEDISELVPASIHTVQPGIGYDGASIYHLSENDIVEVVPDTESSSSLSDSLLDAIYYFFIASAIKRLRFSQKREQLSDMIIHVDRTVVAHENIYNKINSELDMVKQSFTENDSVDYYINQIKKRYETYLSKELQSQYPLDDKLVLEIVNAIKSTGVIQQNGIGKSTKEKVLAKFHRIYIGGDLLQRGLTFPNLIVSYFTRFAKSGGNMDTTLQRARWFGYRNKYLDLCKIFTTNDIAKEFATLAEIEDDLWEQFDDVENGKLEIKDIIIQADNTKQKPTAKNKAKFKKITFKNRWIKQKFIVVDDEEVSTNNERVEKLISSVSHWKDTTESSTTGAQTAKYAIFSAEQLITLIDSIDTAFDREPFNKKPLFDLVGASDIPVILMWTDENKKVRYRSIYNDSHCDRIKALHQGANTTDETRLLYQGDQKVIVDPDKVNIQIHYISPGISRTNLLGKDQYMFAIYVPKDKTYFIKDND